MRKLLGMRHAQQVAERAGPTRRARTARRPAHTGPGQVLFTRALTIGGGTTDIQLNIIGERILGLPRDPEPAAGRPEPAPES